MNTSYMNERNMIITNNNKNDWQGDWRDLISNVGPTSPHSLSACVWHQVPYLHLYHFANLHNIVVFSCGQSVIHRQTPFSAPLSKFVFGSMFTIFPSIVREDIKMSPPITVIEVWDQDKVISNQSWGAEDDDCEISSDKTEDGNWYDAKKIGIFDAKNIVRPQVGKAEFLGRAVAKPKVFLQEDLVSVFWFPFLSSI